MNIPRKEQCAKCSTYFYPNESRANCKYHLVEKSNGSCFEGCGNITGSIIKNFDKFTLVDNNAFCFSHRLSVTMPKK